MSLSSCNRIALNLGNVDIFTFGESTLFGYDSLNNCLILISLIELNDINDQSIIPLILSRSPETIIKELILNSEETILALISEEKVFLVYLPESRNLSLKDSRFCPLNEIPSISENRLIDFIWLSPFDLMIVNSIPSSSECHLYNIRGSKDGRIEFLQTFSVGSLTLKEKMNLSKTNQISSRQETDIIKLDSVKRKEENCSLILVFALKSDGDIYLLTIDENELKNQIDLVSKDSHVHFLGPILVHPSTIDNYGADHRHSRLVCLSSLNFPILILIRDQCIMNQSIFLHPKSDEYHLFNIDSIDLGTNEKNSTIESLIVDRLNENVYYISNSLSNIYSIEIPSINEIEKKQLGKTIVRHIIQTKNLIYQIGLIQTKNKGQCLTIISQRNDSKEKELIILRPSISSLNSFVNRSICLKETIESNCSSEFVDYIKRIVHHDQSLIQSSLSTNVSSEDFQINLLEMIQIFSKEYFEKQEKIRIELKNKEKYFDHFEQTQFLAQLELQNKVEQIKKTFEELNQRYEQENFRRKELSSKVDDILMLIEQRIPVMSDKEILMHQQLTKYRIQTNSLEEKISRLKQFLSTEECENCNEQRINQLSIRRFQQFPQYFQLKIDQMKKQIEILLRKN